MKFISPSDRSPASPPHWLSHHVPPLISPRQIVSNWNLQAAQPAQIAAVQVPVGKEDSGCILQYWRNLLDWSSPLGDSEPEPGVQYQASHPTPVKSQH